MRDFQAWALCTNSKATEPKVLRVSAPRSSGCKALDSTNSTPWPFKVATVLATSETPHAAWRAALREEALQHLHLLQHRG